MGLSLTTIQSLRTAKNAIAQSSEPLASGLQINSAADTGVGLAILQRFLADIASLGRARLAIYDGIGLSETAQSGLSEI